MCRAIPSIRRYCREHRELHRSRPGSDRTRRAAAGRRRTRPGRVLRADGDHRGNTGGLVQPRNERPRGKRRRQGDRRRRPMQRAPAFMFDSAREARDFVDWLTQHHDVIREAAESTYRDRQADRNRAYHASRFVYTALRLHDRRRGRPEHGQQGHLGRLRMDPRRIPPRLAGTCSMPQLSHRQEAFRNQHPENPRPASGRRSRPSRRSRSQS